MGHPYFAFRIAYDGRGFRGFQRQPDQPTVEGALLDAVADLGIDPEAGPGYAAASRTDAGVSAAAQTIAVACPDWLDCEALNGRLPPEIRAWSRTRVPATFHPRYDAIERAYAYVHYAPAVDLDRVRAGCRRLVGEHDFRHLTADPGDAVRSLRAVEVTRADPFLRIRVRAEAFLRQQIRRIVRLLDDLGRGARSISDLESILAGEPLPGGRGIAPADPRSLVLTDVRYDEVSFPDADASTGFRTFEDRALANEREGAALRTVARRIG